MSSDKNTQGEYSLRVKKENLSTFLEIIKRAGYKVRVEDKGEDVEIHFYKEELI
jgi:hypothetical protein